MVQPTPTRVLLADPHRLVTEAVADRLRRESDIDVVDTVATAGALLSRSMSSPAPHVVFSEVCFEDRSGFDAAAELAAAQPDVRIAFLASHLSDVLVEQAVKLGAGYLLKTEPLERVVAAVRRTATGDLPYSSAVIQRLSFDRARGRYIAREPSPLANMSPRQIEILRLIARGSSMREVAEAVKMTEKGAESQKYRIMDRLGLKTRMDLVRYAIREGLIAP
jgi:DNA-binding NarL/FixJ family response regulator